MNDGLIPQRYAKALYKYALERGNAEQVYNEMKTVAASFEAEPSLQKVLANPFVKREDKEKLLIAAAGSDAESGYKAFVKLILDHDREQFAREMALAYRSNYRAANNIAQVVITTASQLPEGELSKLKALVEKAFKGFTLETTFKADSNLIGGFVIDVDSTRMDASVSNEIELLRQNLLRRN